MSFQSPWAFWLVLILGAVLFFFFKRRKKVQASLLFSQTAVLSKIPGTLRSRLMFLPTVLKAVALLLAIFALARPQKADSLIKKNVDGIDIMIALDISDSMLIEDMVPLNRMESAKQTIKEFIKKRTSDRIGMVIFAGESFTLVPLTLDYELLLSRIDEIRTAQEARIKDGTAIGVAMANAAGKLKESTAKSRVMIFMTDGENNSGTIDPETGLTIAKGYGFKIYSVGIGRDGPTRIPIYQKDVFGNRVKTYQPFESTVNEDLLSRMAKETGGKYYRAKGEDSLSGVFNDIDSLEKTKIDVNKYTRYTELFQQYLTPALILYLLGVFLGHTWLRRLP
jgi:Ca-activated chloride channel family protein